jgi:hypothetical protein
MVPKQIRETSKLVCFKVTVSIARFTQYHDTLSM